MGKGGMWWGRLSLPTHHLHALCPSFPDEPGGRALAGLALGGLKGLEVQGSSKDSAGSIHVSLADAHRKCELCLSFSLLFRDVGTSPSEL
jgi:hypothetical protein